MLIQSSPTSNQSRKTFFRMPQLFKRDDANESIHQPTKSILKSKINKNYEAEQSKCKCEELLDFEEFMGRFEYTEQLKNSNDEALSMLRMEQVRNYFIMCSKHRISKT